MLAQQVPFDLLDLVPLFTFFFFPTFAPVELKEGMELASLPFRYSRPLSSTAAHNYSLQSTGLFLPICRCYLNFFQNPSPV